MKTKLTNLEIDFFLSYQFLKNENTISDGINFINNLKIEDYGNIETIDYFISKLEKIIELEISNIITNKNLDKIGILLSGGVDSFLLLYYIRKMFPDLDIYTFTFFPCEANVEDIKSLTKLSKTFKTIHKNIYKNVTFIDIKNSLEFFYSKSKTLIGDEGLIYNNIFLNEIRKVYDGKYLISGDGIDVIFSGMSMYRLSYLEQLNIKGNKIENSFFSDKYEKEYFFKNIKNQDADFFYKYGEFFGGSFLGGNYELVKKYFYECYNQLDKSVSRIKKQIFFSYIFLVENRKSFIYETGILNGFEILTPYIKRSFTRKILELNIPDYYLLNEKYTKIIIRELAFKNINENDIGFNFIKTYKINFYKEFNLGLKYIIYIGYFLLNKGFITKEFYDLVPYFIKNSMWYENKIRVYLLLNLYFFINSDI